MFTQKTEKLFARCTIPARPWRLLLAGGFVACVFGGIALRFAWATPGDGITSTPLVGVTVLGEINTKSETDDRIQIKTKGLSDVYITHIKIVPGGHGGWHSHPGPSIITVKSGTATFYDDCDDPTVPHVFPAGTGFVEDAGCVHLLANKGDTDLEIVVVQIVPAGEPRRIDEPAPAL